MTSGGPQPVLTGYLFWYEEGRCYIADGSDLACAGWKLTGMELGAKLTSPGPDSLTFTLVHTEVDQRENELLWQDFASRNMTPACTVRVYSD
jgi:hypothetical protein